ncbi:MAG: hypothetical protein WCW55_01480 [Patescibacteria group bacterium]
MRPIAYRPSLALKHLKIYQLNSLDDLAVISVLPLWTSKVVAKE